MHTKHVLFHQIVTDAVERLRDKGINFKEQDQSRLISTLLAVICGDAHVTVRVSPLTSFYSYLLTLLSYIAHVLHL